MRNQQDYTHFERKRVKFSFDLELIQIMLKVPQGCKVFVEWGRKNSKLKSLCRLENAPLTTNDLFKISTLQKMVWEQKLYLISGQKFTSNQKLVEQRQNFIRVILQKNGLQKLGGNLAFNIADAVVGNVSKGSQYFQCRLENSPGSNSYLKFLIHYTFVEEIGGFHSSGNFRYKSPSNVSRSPDINKHPSFYQSPRSMNHATPQKIYQNNQYNEKYRKQTEQKIIQLLTSVTGLKNQLHIKTKEVEMLKDEDRLKSEEIQYMKVETNQKGLKLLEEINQLQGEYKKVKQENGRLVVEVQRLKLELIRSERVKERLDQQIFQLNRKCDSLNFKYEEEMELLKNQNERVKFELFESQSRIFKLQSEYQNIQNKKSQISQRASSKLSDLEYEKIRLSRKIQQLEQKVVYYERNVNKLESNLREKKVEKEMFEQKLEKMEKSFHKEQEYYKNAYSLLQERFEQVSRDLMLKNQILQNIELNHKNQIKQKEEEIELMRKKFNSFLSK